MALIVALMLQGIAVTAAFAHVASDGASNSLGFEICRHNGGLTEDSGYADAGEAATPGSAPEGSATHCIFCLAGAAYALDAPLPSADFHVIIHAIVPWPFTAWRLPALTVDASARPRGPPPVA